MTVLKEEREARNPVEEGVSMLPYLVDFQRMHRRRWGAALLATLAAGGLALWLSQRKGED